MPRRITIGTRRESGRTTDNKPRGVMQWICNMCGTIRTNPIPKLKPERQRLRAQHRLRRLRLQHAHPPHTATPKALPTPKVTPGCRRLRLHRRLRSYRRLRLRLHFHTQYPPQPRPRRRLIQLPRPRRVFRLRLQIRRINFGDSDGDGKNGDRGEKNGFGEHCR